MATKEELAKDNLHFSSDEKALSKADVIIVTVPTPVKRGNKPD